MPNLENLLFRTVDGAFGIDSKQKIVLWTAACSHLLGIPKEDALGRNCSKVLRGVTPLGEPFCREECGVAGLTKGACGPRAFPLRVRPTEGEKLKLWVNIILVPSQREDSWICIHLLRRDEPISVFDVLDEPSRGARARREVNSRNNGAPAGSVNCSLTARERTVLELLAEGLSSTAISRVLDIRTVTVRNHIQNIQAKLGVHSQAETVAYAYRNNLVLSSAIAGIAE